MSSALGHLRSQRSLLLRAAPRRRSPPARGTHSDASNKIREPRPWAVENVPPVDPRPTWVFPLSRIANYVVIPGMPISESFRAHLREHVFMPQKAAFFDLSEAEREIAGVTKDVSNSSMEEAESRRDR
ncbi:uncharacterized protein B0H18DRAFT_973347 [Fomitopsis serialis]|uniref:uncharacterized protein n=1 Tax=Fomitopsis serialis TaxID=139415 RepID=UPI002008891F|nr:uncharacterized protein B0H18DRAFT_973347 [Neoantrodia serialis]KAH9936324.1 hypothetical protein B0H18DRAFT_973347 [Neoantrodia serialis]